MTVAHRTCLSKSTGSHKPGLAIGDCFGLSTDVPQRQVRLSPGVLPLRGAWAAWLEKVGRSEDLQKAVQVGWYIRICGAWIHCGAVSWCCSLGVSEDSSCPDQVQTAAIQEPREDPCDLPATLRHALYFACNHSSAQIAGCRKVCLSLCEKIFASAVINIFQLHTGCDL